MNSPEQIKARVQHRLDASPGAITSISSDLAEAVMDDLDLNFEVLSGVSLPDPDEVDEATYDAAFNKLEAEVDPYVYEVVLNAVLKDMGLHSSLRVVPVASRMRVKDMGVKKLIEP